MEEDPHLPPDPVGEGMGLEVEENEQMAAEVDVFDEGDGDGDGAGDVEILHVDALEVIRDDDGFPVVDWEEEGDNGGGDFDPLASYFDLPLLNQDNGDLIEQRRRRPVRNAVQDFVMVEDSRVVPTWPPPPPPEEYLDQYEDEANSVYFP